MSDICVVAAQEVHEAVAAILVQHGVRPQDAALQVTVWVDADLRGQHSHGVQRLFTMLGRIRNGRVNLEGAPTIEQVAPAVLLADGADGLGPHVAFTVLESLAECARSNGIALALVRRSHHLGMLAPYVEWLADRGLIGIASCTSEALVHPWGGSRALVGTNPLAIGIPIADQGPMSLDMSTGAISRGRVLHHSLMGLPLEPGWAVDSAGRPTTDPQDALEGAISPFGGAKGVAAGIDPPVGPVSTEFSDLDAFRASTTMVKGQGFLGRACIHPAQVLVVNEIFTPCAEEVAAAVDLLARMDQAQQAGSGVAIDAGGKMIDEASARSARRILALASSTSEAS